MVLFHGAHPDASQPVMKADDIQACMLKATMDVFASSVLMLGDTERELVTIRAALVEARQLLRNCLDRIDSHGSNTAEELGLSLRVIHFLGDDDGARPMAE
jgi:hypothetical protein